MGEFPILLAAATIVAAILLAPRLTAALRSGSGRGSADRLLGRLRNAFRSALRGLSGGASRRALRGGKRRRRGIDVEADLLRACGGDKALMERLIRHELNRKPELGRTGAALMALSRLRADRR